MPEDNKPTVRPPVETRAGVTGHHASTVLIVSIVAVVIGFAAVYFFYFG
jgi:hypothetical protein